MGHRQTEDHSGVFFGEKMWSSMEERHLTGAFWTEGLLWIFYVEKTPYIPSIDLCSLQVFNIQQTTYRSSLERRYFTGLPRKKDIIQDFLSQNSSYKPSMNRTPLTGLLWTGRPLTVLLTGLQWKKALTNLLWRKDLMLVFYKGKTSYRPYIQRAYLPWTEDLVNIFYCQKTLSKERITLQNFLQVLFRQKTS